MKEEEIINILIHFLLISKEESIDLLLLNSKRDTNLLIKYK